jgi:diguanylate cyclase
MTHTPGPAPRSSGLAVVSWLRRLMLCGFAGYLAWLSVPIGGVHVHPNAVRDLCLAPAVFVLAVTLTLLRVVLVPGNRLAWACFALAGICWAAGDLYFLLVFQTQRLVPVPSWADAGYLAFYPLVWCGLVLLLRRQSTALPRGVWLDGVVGALAAAAVASAFALPTILRDTHGSAATVATNLSYPVADLLLFCFLIGVYALFRWRVPRMWLLLGAGFGVFAVTDSSYLFRSAEGSYGLGTTWDAGWALGFVLVALAAWHVPAGRQRQVRLVGGAALVVPLLSSVLALALLTYGCLRPLPVAPVALAALSVLAALTRTALSFRDVQTLAQARYEAHTDDLTGLANRRQFYARLAIAIADPKRSVAVLMIDLDRFKQVNDSLGHHVGDTLLRLAGARLSEALRSSDLLARIGGDEFGVVLHPADESNAETAAKRLHDVLLVPFVINGVMLHLDASIGVAMYPTHGNDAQQLFRHADAAMYQAKSNGTGWETYNPMRDDRTTDGLATTEALRTALYSDQLVLHYQPKLDLTTGRIAGVEALVRWEHPERGLLYPDDFLPLAEAAGLMPALTTIVLDQALRQCANWRAAGRELTVAVNLSPTNLLDPEMPNLVQALLVNLDLPPSALHLEITETVVMTDPEHSLDNLRQFHKLGIRLAIDDYGTGNSSLAYLSTLPFHDIKLDKSFVIAMSGNGPVAERAKAIVASTITLARALGLDLIAEGVETADTLTELTRLGATFAQGDHLSRPLPAHTFQGWLDNYAQHVLAAAVPMINQMTHARDNITLRAPVVPPPSIRCTSDPDHLGPRELRRVVDAVVQDQESQNVVDVRQ